MNKQDNNPFRSPAAVDVPRQRSSFVYVFACLLWCGLAIKMAVFRPIALSFFDEYGVALPTLTLGLIHPLQTVLFFAVAVAMLSAGLIARTSERRRQIGWVGLLAGLIVVLLIAVGIGLPLLRLMQALS